MKAIVVTRYAGPEALELRDVPEPKPSAHEAMVEVEAAGVNFADLMTATGGYPGLPQPPFVAGREFAGKLRGSGEPVMGYSQSSAFAQLVAARRELLWPIPENWTAEEAAAFPVNYFTAYLAYWKAGVADGQASSFKVLIHAVAGGVGTAAVQIGKLLGAEMYGTSSSEEKLARVAALGLQHGINYKRRDYEQAILELTNGAGVDVVFEMLGGEHVNKSVRCLNDFGRVITYGTATGEKASLDPRLLYSKGASVHGLWLTQLSKQPAVMSKAWKRLSEWASAGKLHPIVGDVLPLERIREAYELLSDRKNFGKVVLRVS